MTGSDQAESAYCERLRAAGIEPSIGHDAANLPEGAEVVVSTAIPEDNPELAAARAAGARVLHRGDLLGELSRDQADDRGGRHARQDHHGVDGRPRADRDRPRAGLPDRRRAARGRARTRRGGRATGP